MLHLANSNPACASLAELFDDSALRRDTAYARIAAGLRAHFDFEPYFGPTHQNLVDMLRSPAEAVPHSLSGQLEFIRERWGFLLGSLVYRLLGSLDLIAEEEKPTFGSVGGAPAPGHAPRPRVRRPGRRARAVQSGPRVDAAPRAPRQERLRLAGPALEAARPALIDASTRSRTRSSTRLARWGFTGLVADRRVGAHRAPRQRIKQLMRQPRGGRLGVFPADYDIADDLGGEAACDELAHAGLAARHPPLHRHGPEPHGHRLALGDRAPRLVHRRSTTAPFPVYSFNGPDLSSDDRGGHLSSRTTTTIAARTRRSCSSGSTAGPARVRYVYHGNDGTSMPWNDTAQLNYLNPEVREAVIQTILHVARLSPIIRFDAAMTLGQEALSSGCGSPSRGRAGRSRRAPELGMTRERVRRRDAGRVLARGGRPRRRARPPTRCCSPRRSG